MNGKTTAWAKILSGIAVPVLVAFNVPIPDGIDEQTAAAIGMATATLAGMLVHRPQDDAKKK